MTALTPNPLAMTSKPSGAGPSSPARVVVALVAGLVLAAPGSASALSPQHADDVRNGYRALTTTFFRTVGPDALLAGARSGIAQAYRKRGKPAPGFASAPPGGETLNAIIGSVDAVRGGGVLSETDATFAALAGMARAAGDKYTTFLTPKDLRSFQEPLNPPHIFGIGVLLQRDDATKDVGAFYVAPGTPADGAGVRNGDVFETIDGKRVHGFDIPHVRALLLGRAGTVVHLQMQRDGTKQEAFTITRAEVHAPTVYQKLLPNGIGYIAVGVFGEPTAEEFGAAIRHLQQQSARAFVIDLRNNGGGYVNAAVAIAGHFVRSGPIVSVAARAGTTEFDADMKADVTDPVAVLVNHYSASASEITAGALQDAGVATLVGIRTYGKGVVQELAYNTDGSAMKVTTARYLTPHNRSIDGIGLVPDVTVKENAHARYGDPAADAQLAAAIGVVRSKARL